MDITYKLPHPVRLCCTETMEQGVRKQDAFFDLIFSDLDLELCSMDYLTSVLNERAPEIIKAQCFQGLSEHNIGMAISSMLIPYKFRKSDGNILTTSNDIDALLEKTDIGDEIPIAYLRPPFKNCYIEFTEDRLSSLKVFNEESGEHILEGVYLSEVEISPNTPQMASYEKSELFLKAFSDVFNKDKPFRVIDMMFTGSPVGKKHNADDALRIQGFYVHDDNLTIKEELKLIINRYGNDDDFANDVNYLSGILEHMAKVLLFTNCKQYRDTAFNEREELEKEISAIKSPSKIIKYNKKLRRTYNRLIIKPEDNVIYNSIHNNKHSDGHSPKKAHWRKGHFRMQPYGTGATSRKVIYIEPTIVGGVFADKKPYYVREK
ncbi:hypothetical protein SJS44_10695 [Aeromonas caviae]|nr:hypothetical protein [Aeromonas caviae]